MAFKNISKKEWLKEVSRQEISADRKKVGKMKIRVAYTEMEQDKKELHEEFIKEQFPGTKVKETASKNGFLHTVLTVPKPKKTTK